MMNSLTNRIRSYTFNDVLRKGVYALIIRNIKHLIHFCRKLRFYFYTKCWLKNILGRVIFTTVSLRMKVGEDATLYPNTIFDVAENADLVVGDSFTLSYGSIIACSNSIRIGDFVMIGEYCSVRDTTHNHSYSSIPYCKQGDSSAEIVIGNNVWIGRGSIILPGSIIEDGVIIGAHSVVKGRLTANCMFAGAPLRMIKSLAE